MSDAEIRVLRLLAGRERAYRQNPARDPGVRAGTKTDRWSFYATVHSATSQRLEKAGLVVSGVRQRFGDYDGHGHWGGYDTYYRISPAGMRAITKLERARK